MSGHSLLVGFYLWLPGLLFSIVRNVKSSQEAFFLCASRFEHIKPYFCILDCKLMVRGKRAFMKKAKLNIQLASDKTVEGMGNSRDYRDC